MFIVNISYNYKGVDHTHVIGKTSKKGLDAFREFRHNAVLYNLATEKDLAKVIVKSDGTFVANLGLAKIYSV